MFRSAATTRLLVPGVLAGLLWAATLSGAAPATHPGCHADDPLALVATLPASADAVIVIEGAARQRVTAAGRSLSAFLGESGLLKETAAAWGSLADSLQLSPEQAFDATLGERVVIVVDGLFDDAGKAGHPRWALLSNVCPRSEARLREALRPAPRAIEAGRPILALENGAYELATSPGGRRSPDDPDAMILLAPACDSALFDSLLPTLAGNPEGPTLSQCPSWSQAVKLGGGDIMLYVRRSQGAGGSDDFLVCSARQGPDGWAARFTASPGLLWKNPTNGPLPEVRPPAGFDALAKGAMAAYCGPLTAPADHDRHDPLALGLPLPQRVPTELAGVLGPTVLLTLHDGPGAGALSLSLAVQTRDTPAAASLGDRLLSRLIARRAVPSQPPADPVVAAGATSVVVPVSSHTDADAPDFRNLRPGDPRVVELTDTRTSSEPGHTYLTWSFPGSKDPGVGGPSTGWWLINLLQDAPGGRSGEQGARRALAHLEGAAAGGPTPKGAAPVVSLARLHPDRLARVLGHGLPPSCSGLISSLRWIDSVEWTLTRDSDSRIAGSFSVRMKSEPAP